MTGLGVLSIIVRVDVKSFDNLLEGLTIQPALSGSLGDVALGEGKFGTDVVMVKHLEHFFLGLAIGQTRKPLFIK